MSKKLFNRFFSILALLFLSTALAQASLQKNLWPRWEMNNPLSKEVISHKIWDDFLKQHVTKNEEGINLINYTYLSKNDLATIKRYIKQLSEIDVDHYNRQEQLAYWINLFNALMVQTVVTHYPVDDLQEINISPGLFSRGPWGSNLVHVNQTPLSLDDINNRIIRPIWNDVRTHYTLSDATLGGPNLSRTAYQGATIEEQLNEAASNYINSLRGVQVIEGKLIVSKVYEWYQEDFGESKEHVIQHLVFFAKEPLASQLKHINTIDSYIYNWHINSPTDGHS